MTPADFPILRAGAHSTSRFDKAIELLDLANEAGSIRNPDWTVVVDAMPAEVALA